MSKKRINKKPGVVKVKKFGPDLDCLEEIIETMSRHGLAELAWQDGDKSLSLKTNAAVSYAAPTIVPQTVFAPAATTVKSSASTVETDTAQATKAKPEVASNKKTVTAPFVGTFYRAPSPGAAVYVNEGQFVKKGDVLCILEAMKLMNELESEFTGKLVSVLAENGQPVEFGEPLFEIET